MATDEQIQRVRGLTKSVDFSLAMSEVRAVHAVCDEVEQLRNMDYLPIHCPVCGRLRLEYNPSTHECRCEKCGADNDVLFSSSEYLRGRVEAAEELASVAEGTVDAWEGNDDVEPNLTPLRLELARFRNTEGEHNG